MSGHDAPGWWQPPRRRRGLLDCFSATVLAVAAVALVLAVGWRR